MELKKYQKLLHSKLINNKFRINSESELIEVEIRSVLDDSIVFVPLVPPILVSHIINYAHWNSNNGHIGGKQTTRWIRQRMWWPGMDKDINLFVSTCHTCQIGNDGLQHHIGRLQPIFAERPRQWVVVDFAGPFHSMLYNS